MQSFSSATVRDKGSIVSESSSLAAIVARNGASASGHADVDHDSGRAATR